MTAPADDLAALEAALGKAFSGMTIHDNAPFQCETPEGAQGAFDALAGIKDALAALPRLRERLEEAESRLASPSSTFAQLRDNAERADALAEAVEECTTDAHPYDWCETCDVWVDGVYRSGHTICPECEWETMDGEIRCDAILKAALRAYTEDQREEEGAPSGE